MIKYLKSSIIQFKTRMYLKMREEIERYPRIFQRLLTLKMVMVINMTINLKNQMILIRKKIRIRIIRVKTALY
jgi:hypothetical protein